MRSISSSALQVAASVVALRLGFASSMGLSGGGSVDSFVRYLSVPGRVSRRNGGVELAPAVRESVGGTPVAGLLCVFALDGLDPLFAVPACTSQHLDRLRIASRLGVSLVAGRSVGAAVTWTNRVL